MLYVTFASHSKKSDSTCYSIHLQSPLVASASAESKDAKLRQKLRQNDLSQYLDLKPLSTKVQRLVLETYLGLFPTAPTVAMENVKSAILRVMQDYPNDSAVQQICTAKATAVIRRNHEETHV